MWLTMICTQKKQCSDWRDWNADHKLVSTKFNDRKRYRCSLMPRYWRLITEHFLATQWQYFLCPGDLCVYCSFSLLTRWHKHKHNHKHKKKKKSKEQFRISCAYPTCAYVERVISENCSRQIPGLVRLMFVLMLMFMSQLFSLVLMLMLVLIL